MKKNIKICLLGLASAILASCGLAKTITPREGGGLDSNPVPLPSGFSLNNTDELIGIAVYIKGQSLEDFYLGYDNDDLIGRIANRINLTRNEYFCMLVAAENYYVDIFRPSRIKQNVTRSVTLTESGINTTNSTFSAFNLDKSSFLEYAFVLVPNMTMDEFEQVTMSYSSEAKHLMTYGDRNVSPEAFPDRSDRTYFQDFLIYSQDSNNCIP
jgi:hypothetical protein